MIKMMKDAAKREPSYGEIADAKVMLSRAWRRTCSGLLVDGYYGYASTVAAFAVPATTGLLVRVEKSGTERTRPARRVARLNRVGALPRSSVPARTP